jgi:hypothetical protein
LSRAAGALAVLTVLTVLLALPASPAAADSFTPVTLAVTVTPIARLHAPLRVEVGVRADAGVLDTSEGAILIGVKLAGECGGTFETTPGTTLLHRKLTPQPTTGQAYAANATGSGRPTAYGSQTLCVFLEDADVGRVYANDESDQVDVSQPCTLAGARYDAAGKALAAAQRRLRHTKRAAPRRRLQRTIAQRRRTLQLDRRAGRSVCGAGVPL